MFPPTRRADSMSASTRREGLDIDFKVVQLRIVKELREFAWFGHFVVSKNIWEVPRLVWIICSPQTSFAWTTESALEKHKESAESTSLTANYYVEIGTH